MKILIISDTHGKLDNFFKVLEIVEPIDLLVHCGDVEGQESEIEALSGTPCHMVSGNNDFFSFLDREKEFTIGGKHVFLTHGHYYHVSMGPERIWEEAYSRGAQIVMYGHTHKPVVEERGAVTLVNPGSLSYPRQNGRRPSYILMELENGKASYDIRYL
ncbi:MAG: metallophosphoesterase [Lachnospiraceae bacterium]|nr:metallophosphoesterase [Lachnospiraceae bacterium]